MNQEGVGDKAAVASGEGQTCTGSVGTAALFGVSTTVEGQFTANARMAL